MKAAQKIFKGTGGFTAGPFQCETRPHAQARRRAGLRLGAGGYTEWASVGAGS